MRRVLLIIIISFLVSSCAHVISRDTLSKATNVPFSTVTKDPFFYEGSLFVWGGVIVKTSLTNEGSVIEIRQSPLDRYGSPEDTDVSEGRFLVQSERHLDPLIYEEGREITVAGILTGTARGRLGEIEYVYPVLRAKEIYLWKQIIYYPPYYYDPWYYDPWYYDSWYYDPWYRWPRHRYPYWRHH